MNEEHGAIQLTIKQAEETIERARKVEKLLQDDLFNEIITDGYLKNDAVRLTMLLKPEADKNEIVNTMMTAKSIFSRYIGNIMEEGFVAEQTLQEHLEMDEEDKTDG